MTDTVAVVAVVVVFAGVVGAAPVTSSVGLTPDEPTAQVTANDTEMAPGERMAGVVGAERAAVESEVAVRAFERRVSAADSSTAKARVVGTQVDDLQGRLDELAAERAELQRAHENGSISTGQYRARLAKLYAEERALQRLANRTERVAADLPEQALREQGVNVTAIRTLKSDARNLTGPEVAEVARGIAGKGVGRPAGAGPPDVANESGGPPGNGGPPGEDGPPGQSGDQPGQSGEDSDPQGEPSEGGPPGNETGASNRSGGNTSGNGNGPSGAGDDPGKPTDTGPGVDRGDGSSDGARNGTEAGSGTSGESGNGSGSESAGESGNDGDGSDRAGEETETDAGT